RGWIRVLKHYGRAIWRSPAPFIQRLDMLVRLANAFGPVASLALTIGALPTALLAERFGFWRPVSVVYASLLVVALLQRVAEARYIDVGGSTSAATMLDWARACLPVGLVLHMGMTPAMTQGTLEGFGRAQRWDVTPKSGASAVWSRNQARAIPASIWITIASAVVAAAFLAGCVWTRHFVAGVFYLLMLTGCTWIAGAFLYEYHGSRRPPSLTPVT